MASQSIGTDVKQHFCADIYGPSESIIGEYLRESGERKDVQVLTKFCCFGSDMQSADSTKFVRRVGTQTFVLLISYNCRTCRNMLDLDGIHV